MAEWTPSEFRDLEDVEFGTPSDEDIPRYDSGTDKLVMGPPQPVAPTGAAGGDLDGTYPNPVIRAQAVEPSHIDPASATGPNQVLLTDGIGGVSWEDPPFVPGPASAISIVDAASDFTATNVEDALAELQAADEADEAALAAHLADTVDAHDASAVSFVPTGTVAATNVQTAIAEVASEAGAGGAAVQANLDAHIADTSDAHDASAISILDAANDFAATNVETALAELQAADEADEAALAAHLADTGDAHDASAISILDAASDFTATDVEGALAELQTADEADEAALAAHLADAADAHAATAIGYAGGTGISATTVEGAIDELATEKADQTITLSAGDGLSGGGDLSANRSFAVNVDGVTIETATDALRIKDGGVTDNKLNSEAAPAGTIATADGLGGVSYEPPAAAAAGASGTFFWAFDDPTSTPPATGTFRLDDTPQEDALAIYFHETDADAVARTLWLSLLAKGDRVVISEEDDATAYVTYEITDPPIDQGAYWEIPVEVFVNGGALSDGERCGVTFLLGAGGGSGETILKEIEQTAHGLAVGDWIRLDTSGDYVLAQADSVDNAEVLGVVVESDPNVFVFVLFGWVDPDLAVFAGLDPGVTYYLDPDVAGAMTDVPPLSAGDVSKPVLTAAAADSGWVRELRGMVNEDPSGALPFEYEARTSNTLLVLADKGKTIDYTTAGFTQTLDDAAVLGDGWWILLRNSTVGIVTLDGDGGDTIDGAVTKLLLPGELRMLLCDGSNFVTIGIEEPYPWQTVRKAADESVNAVTAVQNDDELFFTTVSGAHYEIEFFLIYGAPSGAGTPDIKFAFGEDGTARGVLSAWSYSTTDTATGASILTNQTAVLTFGTAAADRSVKGLGQIVGNGGTFRLLWAQNVSNANNMFVRAGSVLRYRRIL